MPVPEDFYDNTLVFQCDGVTRQSTCGFGTGVITDPGSLSAASMADIVYEAMTQTDGPGTAGQMSSAWRFMGVQTMKMQSDGPSVAQRFEPVRGVGSAAAPPINCAVLIAKQTAAGGRRNRGRMFVPPVFPSEAVIDPAGVISSGDLVGLQNEWDLVLEYLNTNDVKMCLYHQTGLQVPTTVTSLAVSGLLATQRRRMRA